MRRSGTFGKGIFLVLAAALGAQAGYKDGVYTSAEHGARFKLPKAWKLEKADGTDGKIVVFESDDGTIKGVFRHSKDGLGASKGSKARAADFEKKCRTLTWESEEKVAGKEGDWLKVVLAMETDSDEFKSAHYFVSKGKDDFELALLTKDGNWENAEKSMNDILASLEFGEFKEEPDAEVPTTGTGPTTGNPPATGGAPLWADAARGIALRGAAGWKARTEDFRIHDPYEIVEWETGDEEVMICLSEIANDNGVDAKTWADMTVKALGKSFKNQQMLEGTAPAGTERRDFTAEMSENPIRFAYLFFTRQDKAYYVQVMVAGTKWEGSKEAVEAMLGGIVLGDVAKQVEEMKAQPAAGTEKPPVTGTSTDEGKEVLLPNPWDGFGNGSWVKYKMVSDTGGTRVEMEMTTTLIDSDADSYTQKTDTVMNGASIPGQEQKINRRQKMVGGGEGTTSENGDETVSVAKGEFKCHWTKTKSDQGWSQVWTSKDVPTGVVKLVSEYGPSKSSMELLDFEKK